MDIICGFIWIVFVFFRGQFDGCEDFSSEPSAGDKEKICGNVIQCSDGIPVFIFNMRQGAVKIFPCLGKSLALLFFGERFGFTSKFLVVENGGNRAEKDAYVKELASNARGKILHEYLKKRFHKICFLTLGFCVGFLIIYKVLREYKA